MKPSTRAITREIDEALRRVDEQTARCVVALCGAGAHLLATGHDVAARRMLSAAKQLERLPNAVRADIGAKGD